MAQTVTLPDRGEIERRLRAVPVLANQLGFFESPMRFLQGLSRQTLDSDGVVQRMFYDIPSWDELLQVKGIRAYRDVFISIVDALVEDQEVASTAKDKLKAVLR